MKIYMKQNKVLLLFTILTSIIASLGYVFMAVLLQKLLDIAVEKNMQQFIPMVLFSIFYFVMLGIFLYLQSLLSKRITLKQYLPGSQKSADYPYQAFSYVFKLD